MDMGPCPITVMKITLMNSNTQASKPYFRRLLICMLFSVIAVAAQAQEFTWGRSLGSVNYEYTKGSCTDAAGNIYTTGTFSDSMDANPTLGVDKVAPPGSFIQKLYPDGSYAWTIIHKATTSSGGGIKNIACDSSGSVFVTGDFVSTTDFDFGPGIDNHTPIGSSDIFVTKINADGSYGWTKTFGGNFNDYGQTIAVASSGGIVVAGYFRSTVDFDPGAGVDNHTSAGGSDMFITRFDSAGNYLWTKTTGGANYEYVVSISLDPSDNIYYAGYFADPVDFDPGAGTDTRTSAGSYDGFLSKLASDGSYQWTKLFGGTSADYAYATVASASGEIYVTGSYALSADFNPGVTVETHTSNGASDVFISRYNADGSYVWTRTFGSAGALGNDSGSTLAINQLNQIQLAGTYFGTADFNWDAGTDIHTSAGDKDIFLVTLDSAGNYIKGQSFGGPGSDTITSCTFDGAENLIIAGYFQTWIDLDPEARIYRGVSNGKYDTFVSKFQVPNPTPANAPVITLPAKHSSLTNTTPTISGTATAGDNIEVFVNGNSVGTTIADGGGNWTFNLSSPLADGRHEITATATDGGFNTHGPSEITWVDIDTTFPSSINSLYPSDGGSVERNDLTITGIIEPNTTIEFFEGVTSLGSTFVDYLGSFYFGFPFTGGGHTISALYTEKTGAQTTLPDFSFYVAEPFSYDWTKTIGGLQWDLPEDVATDSQNNIFVVGSYYNTVDFNPGPGTDSRTSTGNNDLFLLKLNSDGSYAWSHTFGGISNDEAKSVAIDSADNVYITGSFWGTVDFDPGPGVSQMTSVGYSFFIAKYLNDGTYLWSKMLPNSIGNDLYINESDELFISGEFSANIDFNPDAGVDMHNTNGFQDVFLSKYNSDGSYAWTITFGGNGTDHPHDLKTDSAGNILLAGTSYSNTLDLDPGAGVDTHSRLGISEFAFITKLAPDGTYIWGKSITGMEAVQAYGIASDESDDIYVSGDFRGTVDFDPGAVTVIKSSNGFEDCWLLKLSHNGEYIWSKTFGGTSSDSALDIIYQGSGRLLVAGDFSKTVDFNPEGTGDIHTSPGISFRVFLTRLYSDGSYGWTKTMSDNTGAITEDASGNLLIASFFSGGTQDDMNPLAEVDEFWSNGSDDVAITRLLSDTSPPAQPAFTSIPDGAILNQGTQALSGTAELGSKIQILVDGVFQSLVTTGLNGTWSLPSLTLTEGSHILTFQARDANGNLSAMSQDYAVAIDLTAPAAPIINSPTNNSNTTSTTLEISGSAETNATVEVFLNRVSAGITTADNSGNWAKTVSSLTPDNYSINAQARDAANNISPLSTSVDLTVIGALPVSGQVTLSNLSASPLAGVTVSAGGLSATTDSNGNYLLGSLTPGTYPISAIKAGYRIVTTDSSLTVNSTPVTVNLQATPVLENPAFGLWNSYLGMINILELINTSNQTGNFLLEIFDLSGIKLGQRSITIPAAKERDIILNDMPGFVLNSYGSVRITGTGGVFDGRVMYYRAENSAERNYSFAFSEQLQNGQSGRSSAIYNTYHPSLSAANTNAKVHNWLAIANLDQNIRQFTVTNYDLTGQVIADRRFTVAAQGRLDISALTPGQEIETTGLIEITPDNPSGAYLAKVYRYADGTDNRLFDYAFSAPVKSSDTKIAAQVDTSASANNFVEIANTSTQQIVVLAHAYSAAGDIIASESISLAAKSQRHLLIPHLLPGEVGQITLQSNISGSLIGESIVYNKSASTANISTATVFIGNEPFGALLYSSINSYLGMGNELLVSNISNSTVDVLNTADSVSLPTQSISLTAYSTAILPVTEFNSSAPDYGKIEISTSLPGSLLVTTLRKKDTILGDKEFNVAIEGR